jgi:hypothetical protein
MLRFQRVVLSKRSCGSSTGQVGTTNVERPIGAGRLQDTIGIDKERRGKGNKRFILFISFNNW